MDNFCYITTFHVTNFQNMYLTIFNNKTLFYVFNVGNYTVPLISFMTPQTKLNKKRLIIEDGP